MGGIDLHIHSTASDGTLSPEAIVQLALQKSLSAIAITDHDTVGGIQQLHQQGIPSGIQFINGVEISIEAPDPFQINGSLHLLGYGIDPFDAPLNDALLNVAGITGKSDSANDRQAEPTWDSHYQEQVVRKESVAGRPHVATALLEMGIVKSFDEAFLRYLGNGKPAYVQRLHLTAKEAIHLIQGAGGIAVIAHLGVYFRLDKTSRKKLLVRLKELGLQGVEVYYPSHSPAVIRELKAAAESLNLVITGGTDFHGDIRPELKLGVGDGTFHVPEEMMPMFLKAIEAARRS